MGIDTPVHVSVKEGDLNNVFQRTVLAADRPHLNIPETEVGQNRKLYRHFVSRSLMFVSGMIFLSNAFLLKLNC